MSQLTKHGKLLLQAALAAYLDSCARHGVEVPSGLHLLALDVALLTSHSHQVTSDQPVNNCRPA